MLRKALGKVRKLFRRRKQRNPGLSRRLRKKMRLGRDLNIPEERLNFAMEEVRKGIEKLKGDKDIKISARELKRQEDILADLALGVLRAGRGERHVSDIVNSGVHAAQLIEIKKKAFSDEEIIAEITQEKSRKKPKQLDKKRFNEVKKAIERNIPGYANTIKGVRIRNLDLAIKSTEKRLERQPTDSELRAELEAFKKAREKEGE